MTEDQLEQETLGWLQDVGYTHRYGPDIAHDGSKPAAITARCCCRTACAKPFTG